MTTIAIVYHSIYGHTKLQAEAVLRGAKSVSDVTAKLYTAEEASAQLDELDAADANFRAQPRLPFQAVKLKTTPFFTPYFLENDFYL